MSKVENPSGVLALGAPDRLLTARFLAVLGVQIVFGFSWSIYLIQPKFLTTVLGADPRSVGQISSMSGFAAVCTLSLVVWGIDRIGRRRFLRAGAALLSALSFGYLFVDRLGPLVYVLQGCVGASFVLAYNANATLATDEVPPARMGQALGIFGAANMSMNAVGTSFAEWMAESYGWPLVFRTAGTVALASLALSFFLSERPAARAAASCPADPIWTVLRSTGPVLGCSALLGGAFSAMFLFHQPYALELGARRVSAFFVGFTAAAVLVRLLLGTLGDRWGRWRVSVLGVAAYGAVVALTSMLSIPWLWLFGAAFGTAHGIVYPTLNAYVLDRAPSGARGRVIALYNGSFNAGLASSALLWGWLVTEAGYPGLFLIAGGVAWIATGILYSQRPRRAAS